MSRDIRVCLFIGGPCDGERREVDVEQRAIFASPRLMLGGFDHGASVPMTAKAVSESYIRHPFETDDGYGGRRTDYIYVAHGLNPLGELLEGYVGRKDREMMP